MIVRPCRNCGLAGAGALLGLLFAAGAAAQDQTEGGPSPLALLVCETTGSNTVELGVLLLALDDPLPDDTSVRLQFVAPSDPGRTYEAPEPAPRTVTQTIASSATGRRTALLGFGPFILGDETPAKLQVLGGVAGTTPTPLGVLFRRPTAGDHEARWGFRRASPPVAEGERAVIVVAAPQVVDANRFLVGLGFFNCGERFPVDHWALLHFELEPTGEDLAATSEMGLWPSGKATDSSLWREDEVTVVTFGPYELPRPLERPVYLRAGLYDREGAGDRVKLIGSDASRRVLVGRFVDRDGHIAFERIAPSPEGERP